MRTQRQFKQRQFNQFQVVEDQSGSAVSPDELAAAFTSALLGVLAEVGTRLSLPPVSWLVVEYPDGLVIEGHISARKTGSAAACESWASALGMIEYTWIGDNGQRSWHLEHGAWTLELSCD